MSILVNTKHSLPGISHVPRSFLQARLKPLGEIKTTAYNNIHAALLALYTSYILFETATSVYMDYRDHFNECLNVTSEM